MKFTETGELVYQRTYARTKPDGSRETWPETVARVVDGNLALVDARYQEPNERERLVQLMTEAKVLPAGRHIWASGVKGAQHLFNCWVSGWGQDPWEHFAFTFLRLMEGGGVGASYSNEHLEWYPPIQHFLDVEIVCDREHPDYQKMKDAGLLSTRYDSDWPGAFEVEDSREGWAAALVDLIQTHYRPEVVHLNRVYDVSRVRPEGARLKTFGGRASGPGPLARMLTQVAEAFSSASGRRLDGITAMQVDHALAECVVSGGVRRSARMAMMHWADPQILDFIGCKADSGSHWSTNISVEVDAEFWEALGDQEHSEHVDARLIMRRISEGMARNGEPGFWDSSLSNTDEPNRVICTNPCGEITLEAWEPCNLGHVNLAAFVDDLGGVDFAGLREAHRLMARFLIRATFAHVSDPRSREVLDRNRRIGVGHFGVASYLAMQGLKYSEAGDTTTASGYCLAACLREMKQVVSTASSAYAHQLRIPAPVKVTTVAPTGTIAKMPGVSEGIHPIFSRYFIRRIRFSTVDPDQVAKVEEYRAKGYHVEDALFEENTVIVAIPTKDTLVDEATKRLGADEAEKVVQSADELSLTELLSVQATYQRFWADNAVSFTANIDPEKYTTTDVAKAVTAFGGRIKGATVFPEASYKQAPYERITKEQYEASAITAVADGVDEECANGGCPIR